MAVPTVSKAVPRENPPETSDPAQEIGSPEKASIQTTSDQPNGVAATQEKNDQTEEIGLVAAPASQQEATIDPVGDSADLPAPEDSVPSAETPIASSEGLPFGKEGAPTEETQSQSVAAEESASQKVEQNSAEVDASGGEPEALEEKILESKPSETNSQQSVVADEKSISQEVEQNSVEVEASGGEPEALVEKILESKPSETLSQESVVADEEPCSKGVEQNSVEAGAPGGVAEAVAETILESKPSETQSEESVVADEESASQEVEQNIAEAEAPGSEPQAVAEKVIESKTSAPEDVYVNSEDGNAAAVEDLRNQCLDVAEDEVLPGDANVSVATQNENPEKEEPVTLLSKAIQSKGNSKCEDPRLSTRHLSGWFILCEMKVLPALYSNLLNSPIGED